MFSIGNMKVGARLGLGFGVVLEVARFVRTGFGVS